MRKLRCSVILLVFVLCYCLLGFGCGYNSRDKLDEIGNQEDVQKEEYTHLLGETVFYDGLYIMVNSFDYKESFGGVKVLSSSETLLVANVTLLNTTKQSIKLNLAYNSQPYSYLLIYDNIYSYNQTWSNSSSFLIMNEEIKALETINANLCFKIPTLVKENECKSLTIRLSSNRLDTLIFHYWNLR